MPVTMQTTAGTKNAPRQSRPAIKTAVVPAASATPRFPHTPLKATERPREIA